VRRPTTTEKYVLQRELDLELFDYVNWFNNIRIHGSLDYLTPKEFKEKHLAETPLCNKV